MQLAQASLSQDHAEACRIALELKLVLLQQQNSARMIQNNWRRFKALFDQRVRGECRYLLNEYQDDYLHYDYGDENDDLIYSPGMYVTGNGDRVFQVAGERSDITACDSGCGYCIRCAHYVSTVHYNI